MTENMNGLATGKATKATDKKFDKAGLTELFPVKKNCLYFNFAADGPLPVPSRDAMCAALVEKSETGYTPVPKQIAVYEDLRRELSVLFRSGPDRFAFTKNTSEGVLLALTALDIREGENYIVAADAFPTTVKMLENNCRGEARCVRFDKPEPLVDQVRGLIDRNTRAVVLDWVHYFTGRVIDIPGIIGLVREKNRERNSHGSNDIFTIIDGIQGCGALRLDLDDSGIDFFVSGGHKWMLSPQGSGFIYVSPRVWERIPRRAFGWLGYNWLDFSDFSIRPELRQGAEVLEYGTRSYNVAVGFRESLRLINGFGIDHIEAHNRQLRDVFAEGATQKGYEIIAYPRSTSIVPFRLPGTPATDLRKQLHRKKVILVERNGYLRAAFHLVNDMDEVQQLVDLL